MRRPANTPITMLFGSTAPPYSMDSPHKGTDFAYTPDDTIYAPFAGLVYQLPNNGKDGNGTYMNFGNQFHGLLHASKYLVPNNTYVQEGQPIAKMGDTGFAQGVHLHWCIKVNGQFIDPMSLLNEKESEVLELIDTDDKARDVFVAVFHEDAANITQDAINSIKGQAYSDVLPKLIGYPKWKSQNDKLVTAGGLTSDQQAKLDAATALAQSLKTLTK